MGHVAHQPDISHRPADARDALKRWPRKPEPPGAKPVEVLPIEDTPQVATGEVTVVPGRPRSLRASGARRGLRWQVECPGQGRFDRQGKRPRATVVPESGARPAPREPADLPRRAPPRDASRVARLPPAVARADLEPVARNPIVPPRRVVRPGRTSRNPPPSPSTRRPSGSPSAAWFRP